MKQDLSKAMQCYRKAAQLGDKLAMVNVGVHYYYGSGVKQNYQQALYWFNRAANVAHDHHAQYMLALMYAKGRGVHKDVTHAKKLLTAVGEYYYRSQILDEAAKRKAYVDMFVTYQIAQFLGKTLDESQFDLSMIENAKRLSEDMAKDCSANDFTPVA